MESVHRILIRAPKIFIMISSGMILWLHLQYKTQSKHIACSIRNITHRVLFRVMSFELYEEQCERISNLALILCSQFQSQRLQRFKVDFVKDLCNFVVLRSSHHLHDFESSRMHCFSFLCLYSITAIPFALIHFIATRCKSVEQH